MSHTTFRIPRRAIAAERGRYAAGARAAELVDGVRDRLARPSDDG